MASDAGVTKIAAAAGVVRFNRNGVLFDPSGSATIVGGQDPWIAVTGADALGGQDWGIVSRPAPAQIDVQRLGGGDWEFALSLFDRPLHTAVISGQSYPLR